MNYDYKKLISFSWHLLKLQQNNTPGYFCFVKFQGERKTCENASVDSITEEKLVLQLYHLPGNRED